MDHSEAVKQMAVERYLLDELTPEAREGFEAHVFDCPECALDLRAAAAFVDEAKLQLPELAAHLPVSSQPAAARPRVKRDGWFSWVRPAFAVPVFAALLMVVCYQNVVTFPALRAEATQPRLLPWVPVHIATRGEGGTHVAADHVHGVALRLDLSAQTGAEAYGSYAFDLLDSRGKVVWSGTMAASAAGVSGAQRILLAIPGAALHNGAYSVQVFGGGNHGERTPIEEFLFDVEPGSR